MLGYMDSQGWHYYNDYYELEILFWQTFEEAVEVLGEELEKNLEGARFGSKISPYALYH